MKAVFALHPLVFLFLPCLGWLGCGSTQNREATEQLLTSDAVDRSIAQIDFRALSGKTVYFDTTYLKNPKGVGFVNAEYIISSLRQQLVAARCLLQDKKEDAEYVVEARIGTLGTDRHEVIYGMPANNFLSAASSLVPGTPPLPTLPELSAGKRIEQLAAAKIAAFAYHRETSEPVWQSGMSSIRSLAEDTWFLGAGPFQHGDIYDGSTRFAGVRLKLPGFGSEEETQSTASLPLVDYNKTAFFKPIQDTTKPAEEPSVGEEASNEETLPETKPAPPKSPEPAPPVPPPDKPAPPAVAESKPDQKPQPALRETPPNPLESATELESGLRLRFHFNETSTTEDGGPGNGGPSLFRLDPIE